MRGALIHGVLLAVMLVYGYRTWTRDKSVKPDLGSVVLWDKSEKDIVSIAYKGESREVKLEQRTQNGETYWWGTDTVITKTPKPTPPPEPPKDAGSAAGSGAGSGSAAKPPKDAGSAAGSGAGSGSAAKPPQQGSGAAGSAAGSGSAGSAAGSGTGSGSAGSGAGSGSAAPPPPKPQEFDETRKTREFPLGEGGTKLVKNYSTGRAIRDLGTPTDAQKKTYKLDAPKGTITITFKDGTRTFQLGDKVFGNEDKYALDDKGRAYVLSKDMLIALEAGEPSLQLADARGFDTKLIESVTIEGAGKVKTGVRTQTEVEGRPVKTWADAETKKPHPSLGNFIDQIGSMPPTEYSVKTKVESLTPIVKVTYKDASGDKLGTLTLYKGEKPPAITPDMEIDPANPPRGEVEYFIVTEKSRVPAVVRKDTAQQVETNLPVIMNEKPPEPGKSIDPKGNPFGPNAPKPSPSPPPPPGGLGGDPHGHGAAPGADPHGHGAPPAPPAGGGLTPTPPAPPTPPAAGSAAAPKAGSAVAPKPAAGSAAAPKPAAPKPAAGSAAAPKPAAPKPATGSAAAPKPAAPKPAAPAGSAQ